MMNTIQLLLIEDNQEDSKLIKNLLAESVQFTFKIHAADTLAKGLKFLDSQTMDIILVNLNLSDSAGLNTIRTVRQKAVQPILILSGINDEQLDLDTVREGAQDMLLKGDLNLHLLEKSIRTAIERHHADLKLRRAKQEWETTFDAMSDWVALIDTGGIILRTNKACRNFVRLQEKDVIGRNSFELMNSEYLPDSPLNQLIESGTRQNFVIKTEDAYWRIVMDPIRNDFGQVVSAVQIVSDMTQQMKTENELKQSLAEKDLLLHEVHHRVKNNMQVITSLLNLQARHVKDSELGKAFKESQYRIQSMSLIYELLYRSKNLSRVSIPDYVRMLTTELYRAYGTDPGKIRLHMDLDDLSLDIRQMIPVGLVLNELVSNSLKHAFPDRKSGKIIITMKSDSENHITLTVADDGIGYSGSRSDIEEKTMGMNLVRMLVNHQLSGKYELKLENGTRHCITFSKGLI